MVLLLVIALLTGKGPPSHPDSDKASAGTLLTAELALQHGLACNTAGGTHHAFPAFGSGFCILNDLAVTAEVLLHRKVVDRILVLDLDVHQVLTQPSVPKSLR